MALTNNTAWQAGDRVYSVAQPALTGTVLGTSGAGYLVNWDFYTDRAAGCCYEAGELDYYTLPLERVAVDTRGWIVAGTQAVTRG